MSELTLFQSHLPQTSVQGGLRKIAAIKSLGGGKPILRFTKRGQWEYGPEDIEVDSSEEWAVNPSSFHVGVIGWRGGTVVGEHMFPAGSSERVDHNSLEPINTGKDSDGWKEQITFELKSMKDGTEVIFKTTSRGGMNAVATLSDVIAAQLENDPGHPVAIVRLSGDGYDHKSFGRVETPIFLIEGWADMQGDRGKGEKQGKRKLV